MLPITFKDWQRHIATLLANTGITQEIFEARALITTVLGVSTDHLLLSGDMPVTPVQAATLREALERRCRHEPLSRILGRREFWGLDFQISSDTLDPRPDSETVITALCRHYPDRQQALTILDMGTGSGCLLLAALTECPNATGVGVDISVGALTVAKKNAATFGLHQRAQFLKANWGQGISGQFDVILSNPPYIEQNAIPTLAPDVRNFDPITALDGGLDGLDAYRSLMPDIQRLLSAQGIALLEVGMGQAEAVTAIASANGLQRIRTYQDLGDIPRCLVLGHEL